MGLRKRVEDLEETVRKLSRIVEGGYIAQSDFYSKGLVYQVKYLEVMHERLEDYLNIEWVVPDSPPVPEPHYASKEDKGTKDD